MNVADVNLISQLSDPALAAEAPDRPMMGVIVATARTMFPGDAWDEVEAHIKRAWNDLADPASWEQVQPWIHAEWLRNNGGSSSDGA